MAKNNAHYKFQNKNLKDSKRPAASSPPEAHRLIGIDMPAEDLCDLRDRFPAFMPEIQYCDGETQDVFSVVQARLQQSLRNGETWYLAFAVLMKYAEQFPLRRPLENIYTKTSSSEDSPIHPDPTEPTMPGIDAINHQNPLLPYLPTFMKYLEACLACQDNHADGWAQYGAYCEELALYPQAENAFRKCLQANPRDAEILNRLGLLLILREKFTEASAVLGKATRLDPENPIAWQNLGLARVSDNRLTEAEAAWERSAELNPFDPTIWVNLSSVASQLGRVAAAAFYRQRAKELGIDLALDPANPRLRNICYDPRAQMN